MKATIKNRIYSSLLSGIVLTILLLSFSSCKDEVLELPPRSDDLQIGDFVAADEQFSEFDAMIRETQIRGLLNSRGPFTLLLPTNDAFFAYYQEKGISSYAELDSIELRELILNHILLLEVESNSIPYGALPSVNAIGDILASRFEGIETIINGTATIIKRDIVNQNGLTHVVDQVLAPFEFNVFETLKSLDGYSIFTEAIDVTGIKDTLSVISIPFGKNEVRTRYTILAVHDTVFNNRGIQNLDELIEKYSPDDDDITSNKNKFYQYVEYHCLNESFFFSEFPSTIQNYPDISEDKYVNLYARDDYQINTNDATGEYTGIFEVDANIPSKNGVIHSIDDLLPVIIPEPRPILWELTDHFDIVNEDFYLDTYHRYTDGQNELANVKWEGDFLLYYFKPSWNRIQNDKINNGDCFQMNGSFWIEFTTPKIPKGKYLVSLRVNQSPEAPNLRAYIDGVRCDTLVRAQVLDGGQYEEFPFKVVNWSDTETHTIKFQTVNLGFLFFDYLYFDPID